MSWMGELQQASFRGVPFAVLGGEGHFGRRVAVHEYPKRDKPYVEDMGRSTRRIRLVGFLIEDSLVYRGGSVLAQRDAMVAAAEAPGPATLVHPTLGRLTVSVPDGGLVVAESWERGRYFELNFAFIESGDRIFPSIAVASSPQLGQMADQIEQASGLDFVTRMIGSINLGLGLVEGVVSLGQSVVSRVVNTVAGYAELAGQAARDATNLSHLASLLTGDYGRYANGATSSAYQADRATSGAPIPAIGDLIAQATQYRQAVDEATAAAQAAAAAIDASTVSDFPGVAQAIPAAVLSAAPDPTDAVRLLSGLSVYAPTTYVGTGQVGQARAIAQDATSALLRRASLAALLRAVALYVPSSYDDAAALRSLVLGYLDGEILTAGDAGDDASYAALRAARQGVAGDLTTRGGSLARLKQYALQAPLPALTLANRLYQDAARAEQLIAQTNPIHPAFMPLTFQALAD